jgi:hypothetical protein
MPRSAEPSKGLGDAGSIGGIRSKPEYELSRAGALGPPLNIVMRTSERRGRATDGRLSGLLVKTQA